VGEARSTRRIGVVGIVVQNRELSASMVQSTLSEYSDLIVGRMGIPYREKGVAVIALIVDGDTDRLGGLTGRLGSLDGVHVRSALTSFVDVS
jgi:putative iron-only hydrogenase system regulator